MAIVLIIIVFDQVYLFHILFLFLIFEQSFFFSSRITVQFRWTEVNWLKKILNSPICRKIQRNNFLQNDEEVPLLLLLSFPPNWRIFQSNNNLCFFICYILHSMHYYKKHVFLVQVTVHTRKCRVGYSAALPLGLKKNALNPIQVLFWRKENNFLDQTIVKK